MEKTYIFGHHNPDTDSVTSAIALSYFKNEIGMNTEPRVLDEINKETCSMIINYLVDDPRCRRTANNQDDIFSICCPSIPEML